MTYTLIANSACVLCDADGATIPADQTNVDWQAYQGWLAAGNAPTPAPTPPTPPTILTFLQFMALFTSAEQAAIVGSSDVQVKLFLLMASGAGEIGLGDVEVATGLNYLAAPPSATPPGPGLITAARAGEILANQPPG